MSTAIAPVYTLVASDTEDQNGRRVAAWDVWERRYSRGVWPLYARTPNSHALPNGARLLFYIGGKGRARQSFVGEATVKEIMLWDTRKGNVDAEEWLTNSATSIIVLENLRTFSVPVPVKPLLDRLECAPRNKSKWGVIFHGGIRRLSPNDGATIIKEAMQA